MKKIIIITALLIGTISCSVDDSVYEFNNDINSYELENKSFMERKEFSKHDLIEMKDPIKIDTIQDDNPAINHAGLNTRREYPGNLEFNSL